MFCILSFQEIHCHEQTVTSHVFLAMVIIHADNDFGSATLEALFRDHSLRSLP
jgi:hypothetical protein